MTALVSGGATLGLFIKSQDVKKTFSTKETAIYLLSSCLAIAFGTLQLLSNVKPQEVEAITENVGDECTDKWGEVIACETTTFGRLTRNDESSTLTRAFI